MMMRWRFLGLHGLFLIYALGGVAAKKAASYEWGSEPFLLFGGSMFLFFGLYALAWQRILRYFSLTMAYAHRSIMILWGMIFGQVFFNEIVTVGKMIGVLLAMCGLVVFSRGQQEKDA